MTEESTIYKDLSNFTRINERQSVVDLIEYLKPDQLLIEGSKSRAKDLAHYIRKKTSNSFAFNLKQLIYAFPINTKPATSIMTLAESLVRIKDVYTQNLLIKERLKSVKSWIISPKKGFVLFLFSLALQLMKLILPKNVVSKNYLLNLISRLFNKVTKVIIYRIAVHFVLAETIKSALKKSKKLIKSGYSLSYDMLGEEAKTDQDAINYFNAYKNVIIDSGKYAQSINSNKVVSVSVKISSLHSRYELIKFDHVRSKILNRLLELCYLAAEYNIPLFIDAEESDRLTPSLELLENILKSPKLRNWNLIGFALQSYQKRAFYAIDEIAKMAKTYNKKIYLRLVKGAYWDAEIKRDQSNGVEDFSVFTRKEYTDISYLACAKKISSYTDLIYPCFATHNTLSIAYIEKIMKGQEFEFQCLHGMGGEVYDKLVHTYSVRKYAPIGIFKNLLPYLVRRLLENSTNGSFVNQIANKKLSLNTIVKNPLLTTKIYEGSPHHLVKLPSDIFKQEQRINSKGLDMANKQELISLQKAVLKNKSSYLVYPIINGKRVVTKKTLNIINPSDLNDKIGTLYLSDSKTMTDAINDVHNYFNTWNNLGGKKRSVILKKAADLFEQKMFWLASFLVREAGKTMEDAIADIREGIDFLRYYAEQSKERFDVSQTLPSTTGEKNTLMLEGKGVFLCIAPWNFPFAIFIGQIAAALAAGNTVLAKPAERTSLIGFITVNTLLEAGLPKEAIAFIPGHGKDVGNTILDHKYLSGVAFTGSTQTAQTINRKLSDRSDQIIPLIAETGGQNAMIVDSTALPERAAINIVSSSFQSAGQRCSALRVLYIQSDVADDQITMLKGMMKELKVGNPSDMSTDIGPIITEEAKSKLNDHIEYLNKVGKHIFTAPISEDLNGNYFAPVIYEIKSIKDLPEEVFGPILHIIRFDAKKITDLVEDINSTNYGLTFSIQSMLQERIDYFSKHISCGNIYINRNQIGAIVGSQPFGGRGKSGTGPKAGGPYYLYRFANEKTISVDTTAIGGDTELLSKV